jgi:peptide/nickel transport system substrate-binding protein
VTVWRVCNIIARAFSFKAVFKYPFCARIEILNSGITPLAKRCKASNKIIMRCGKQTTQHLNANRKLHGNTLIRRSIWGARILFPAVLVCLATATPAPLNAQPAHAIAMHGTPLYPPDFTHLNYVNPDAPKGGELVRGVLGSFDSLNPNIIKGQVAAGMREHVYESLMARSYDEPFSLYGLLAESIETPPDRGETTFVLRPEARFSDGQPVTAEDVLFSFQLLKEKGRPNHRSYYAKVAKAEKTGERGVRFVFAAGGDREMPLIMGLMPILPRHATDEAAFEKTTLFPLLGSGPYIVSDIQPGSSITYKRNPSYWGKSLPINRGHNNFDTIRYDYYRDSNAMMEAFRKQLFHMQPEGDPVRWANGYEFPAVASGEVRKLVFDIAVPAGMSALVFNTRKPLFADVRVREALTLLFDFEWINKNLFHGLYVRTQSYFDRSELSSFGRPASEQEQALLAPYKAGLLPGALEGTLSLPRSDASGRNREGRRLAMALLNAAGYRLDGASLVDTQTGQPFAFEMLAQTREQERLMLSYATALRQSGIDAQVRQVDSAQYQRRLTAFDFDMVQSNWPASLSPGNEQLFRWSQKTADQEGSFNLPGVKSAGVDAMIAAMLGAGTREDLVAAVRALDRLLLSGRYVIPLYHLPKQWVAVWRQLEQPPGSTLYGYRTDGWWAASQAAQRQ